MTQSSKRGIQIVLAVLLVASGGRMAWILYERSGSTAPQKTQQAPSLDPDYYVYPHKLHDYDFKSLKRDLTGKAVWVKEGYRFTYYPFDPNTGHADFGHEAGTLGPIEKLTITNVVRDRSPGEGKQIGAVRVAEDQIMAVFAKNGHDYAFSVGAAIGGQYEIAADEIVYIQDPHDLYKHWPPDVWQAVEQHQMKPGMNEIQASFAIGMGVPEKQSDPQVKVVHYPNGGKPLTVTYHKGHASEITQG